MIHTNKFIKNKYLAESTDEMMSYLIATLQNISITCYTCTFNDSVLEHTSNYSGNIFTTKVFQEYINTGQASIKFLTKDTALDVLNDPTMFSFEEDISLCFTILGGPYVLISPSTTEQAFNNWIFNTLLNKILIAVSTQISSFNKKIILPKLSLKIKNFVKKFIDFPEIKIISGSTSKRLGSFVPDSFKILIFTDPHNPEKSYYHTLLHEYEHFISYALSLERLNQNELPSDFYSSYPENPYPVKGSEEEPIWGDRKSEHQAEIITMLYKNKKDMFFFLYTNISPNVKEKLLTGTMPIKELIIYLHNIAIPTMLKSLQNTVLRSDLNIFNHPDSDIINMVDKFFMDNIKEFISYLRNK